MQFEIFCSWSFFGPPFNAEPAHQDDQRLVRSNRAFILLQMSKPFFHPVEAVGGKVKFVPFHSVPWSSDPLAGDPIAVSESPSSRSVTLGLFLTTVSSDCRDHCLEVIHGRRWSDSAARAWYVHSLCDHGPRLFSHLIRRAKE